MTQVLDRVVVINRIALPVKAPDRVLVVPWGNVESTKGDFIVDAECAAAVIEAFKAQRVDLPIDFEHTTVGGEFSSPTGEAPAVGWIKSLSAVEGEGIFAEVEWTEHGAELVETKAYRYLSPVTLLWKKDRRLAALHSVALTNKPAITGMHPIVNKDKVTHMDAKFDKARWFLNLEELATEEEILMKLEEFLTQLRELAGAAENADQAAVLSAVKEKAGAAKAGGELRAAVCKAAVIDEKAKDEEIVDAVSKLKASVKEPPTGDVVPKAQYDALGASHKELSDKVAGLEVRVNKGDAETRIKEAEDAGLLAEHMLQPNSDGKNYFRELAEKPKEWEAWKERAPVVVPKSGRVVANSTKAGGAAVGGERTVIIANAKAEFDENERTIACSRRAYINECLREQEHKPLSDDEVKAHAA